MRTLRSGKSLPDSPPVRRPGSTNAVQVPKPASEKTPTPAPTSRRASTVVSKEKESPQKKDVKSPVKNELKRTPNPTPEIEVYTTESKNEENEDPSATVVPVEVEQRKSNGNDVIVKDEEVFTKSTKELHVESETPDEATPPARGRPRKSARQSEIKPKVEVPPTPPTDRLIKTEICQVCGMGFTRKATLLRHSKIHEVEAPEPEPPKRKSVPKIVKAKVKAQSPVITCDVCGLTFTRKAHLDRHALLHSGERPFPCDLCSSKFTRKDHMLSHRVKHTGETAISCPVCGLNFPSMKNLDDHAKEEHPTPDPESDTFTCETCGKHFLQKRYLQAHRKLHMRNTIELESIDHSEIEYQSPKINSRTKSEHSDIQYQSAKQRSAAKPQEGQTSGSGNKSNPQKAMVFLNRVVKLSADLALKSLQGCDTDVEVCLQDFDGEEENSRNNDDLEEMDCDYETMVKQFPVEEGDENSEDAYAFSATHPLQLECSVCGKGFTDRATLRKHYRVHKKKFICRFCGLKLASAGSLMRHNLIHTGRKEFGCNLCGRKFSRKDTLAVHISAHDKSTTRMNMPRPYLCTFCGASYTMKYNLIRHLKMCHSSSLKLNKAQGQGVMNETETHSASSSAPENRDMVISLMPDLETLPQRFEDEDEDVDIMSKMKIKNEPIDDEDYDESEFDQWNAFETEEYLENSGDEPQETDETNEQVLEDEDGKYACNHCGKTFKNSKSLNTHKWYHSREKQFVCHICKRGFKYSTDLNRHLNTHTLSKSKLVPSQNQIASISKPQNKIQSKHVINLDLQQQRTINNALETRPFGCKLCPQRFNHRSNLSRHVRLLHNSTAARKRIPNSVNLQNYLKKLQVQRPGPQVQITRVVQQPLKPMPKEKETARPRQSWEGMNLLDTSINSSNFSDQDMNGLAMKDFSFSIDLSSSKPFSCNVCGKAFENKSNLWTHMRIHNKAFTCSFCGLKVATHGDLVLHVRTHTGERPFSCNLCEWKFSRKSALNKHTQKYHTPGKGKVLRPWKYREERMDVDNGNLKFKFIRSSPQKDDFQIQKMGNANVQIANNMKVSGNISSKAMSISKPLPRLAPAPVVKQDMNILKSVLQDPVTGSKRPMRNSSEPGPSPKLPQLQKSPLVTAQGGKPPGRTNVLFLCRKCKQLITGKANYIEHMKTHQAPVQDNETQKIELKINRNFEEIAAKPFSCDECGQRFGQKAHLSRHQLSHQQSEVARCDVCGKICSSLGFLSRHYQYVHPDTFNPAEQARFRVAELDSRNSPQLDWAVPEVVMNEVDDRRKEPDRSKSQKFNKPSHSGSLNSVRSMSSFEMNEEQQDGFNNDVNDSLSPPRIGPDGIELPTPCERCGKEFNSKKARSDHVWYCKREKIHRCPVSDCNKEFKLKHDVVRHLKRHTNDKRFGCSMCQGRFFHKQDLDRHLRSIHKLVLTDHPFPCDFCEMQYNTEPQLNRHMKQTHGVDSSDIAIDTRNDREEGDFENKSQGLVRSRSSMEEEYEDYLIENDMENEEFEESQDEMPDPSSFLEQSMGESTEQQQHDCELCGKSFSTRQKYMYHKYYHEREAKYSCTDCEERFKLRSHLERHIRTYHNNLKPVNKDKVLHCSQCPRKFTREYDLNTHINKVHMVSTPTPHPLSILKTTLVMGNDEEEDNIPSTSSSLSFSKTNRKLVTTGPNKNTSASLAMMNPAFQNYDESGEYEMEEYMSQEDEEDTELPREVWETSDDTNELGVKDGVFRHHNGTYTCELCGKIFKEKKAADAHRYYHNREEKYACKDCGARFKQNSDLQRHNRIHHNSRNPKISIHCPHCKRSFTDDRYMRMHIRRYHPEVPHQGSMESSSPEENIDSSNSPRLHVDKLRPTIKKEPVDYDDDDGCEGDGRFSSGTGVWNVDENFVDLTIVENEDEEENSSIIKNWGAPVGNSKDHDDDDQSGTDEDMNAIEEVEYRNYQERNEAGTTSSSTQSCSVTCGSCGAGLEDTNAIKLHICTPAVKAGPRRHSENSNPRFDCIICGATFARSNELILHNRVHTGVKPFICSQCGKNFVQRADLNAHLQTEHNQSMQTFDCQFCPKRFFVKKSLDSHRRRHHGNIIQFYKCRQCGKKFTAERFLDAHSRTCGTADSHN